MGLFFKNKLKIETTIEEGKAKTAISYFNVKDSESIKLKLLRELISSNNCLAVMNTALLYQIDNADKETTVSKLINGLDEFNINYCKKSLSKDEVIKIFGISTNLNNQTKIKEYRIGFAINADNLEAVLNSYDLHYYISKELFEPIELVNLFENNYLDEEALSSNFNYDIFVSNYLEHLVIISSQEDSEFIRKVVSNIA